MARLSGAGERDQDGFPQDPAAADRFSFPALARRMGAADVGAKETDAG